MELDEPVSQVKNIDLSGNLSSGDDEDFQEEYERQTSQNNQKGAKNFQYEVLTMEKVVKYQEEMIDEVNIIINLPPQFTRILLHLSKWDKEKLLEKYFDDSDKGFLKLIHVVNPLNKPSECDKQESLINHFEHCEICLNLVPSESLAGLECGHRYCSSCWDDYLTSKILTEGLGTTIQCAAHGCELLVNDVFVIKFVTDERVKIKYQQFITNSFIECNKLLRWCPATDCTYVIKVACVEFRSVSCKCGHVFCFLCGQNWHGPVKCQWFKKWIQKCNDDPETSNWIAINTKECPKCNVIIQKDGGCNHMFCMNQNCKHEFCWVCLGPWQPHALAWDNCNRYDAADAKAARNEQRKRRAALTRFLHYHNRYLNHMQSLNFEKKLYALFKGKYEKIRPNTISSNEAGFLKKTVNILCECRKTLMNTYVFAYYLEENNQTLIFESNQKDFEAATEKLSECLERDITAANVDDIKVKVQDICRYCEMRRNVLLDHVNEGYEENWWTFKE